MTKVNKLTNQIINRILNLGSKLKDRVINLSRDIWKSRESYLLLAPFALIFTLFTIIPVLISIGLSFTYYNILEAPKWVGWLNYINLLLNAFLLQLPLVSS